MRIYRRQRTLWRAAIVALLDIAVICLASLVAAGDRSGSAGSASYTLETPATLEVSGIPAVVSIEADSTVYLDGIPLEVGEITEELRSALSVSSVNHVTVEAAQGVPFDIVSRVLGAATAAGPGSLSLAAGGGS
jgi:biopolymer transport protein ExbD